jgi:hypothetical protein
MGLPLSLPGTLDGAYNGTTTSAPTTTSSAPATTTSAAPATTTSAAPATTTTTTSAAPRGEYVLSYRGFNVPVRPGSGAFQPEAGHGSDLVGPDDTKPIIVATTRGKKAIT